MSHYAVLVIGQSREDVQRLLQRYKGHEWDWYQFGGRWTGLLDGYQPRLDPNNIQPTGEVKWPTQWAVHAGDQMLLAQVSLEHYKKFYAVCCEDGWFKADRYEPWREEGVFPTQELPPLEWLQRQYPSAWAFVVDCHN